MINDLLQDIALDPNTRTVNKTPRVVQKQNVAKNNSNEQYSEKFLKETQLMLSTIISSGAIGEFLTECSSAHKNSNLYKNCQKINQKITEYLAIVKECVPDNEILKQTFLSVMVDLKVLTQKSVAAEELIDSLNTQLTTALYNVDIANNKIKLLESERDHYKNSNTAMSREYKEKMFTKFKEANLQSELNRKNFAKNIKNTLGQRFKPT